MQITLPERPNLAALFLLGERMQGGAVQKIGSILVKALYRLEPTVGGDDTHELIPADSAPEFVFADQSSTLMGSAGLDVEREADIAPYKDRADIVVEGFLPEEFDPDEDEDLIVDPGGTIKVNGATWMTRGLDWPEDIEDLPAADRKRHLFGYQPRSEHPRGKHEDDVNDFGDVGDFNPPVPDANGNLPAVTLANFTGYSNRFLNVYRRGEGYLEFAVGDDLPPGTQVEVFKTLTVTTDTDPDLAVTLSHPPLAARYRAYCGHGPDRPTRWSIIRLGLMRTDTLILKPDGTEPTAEVFYRTVWPWSDQPAEHYRAIHIQEDTV